MKYMIWTGSRTGNFDLYPYIVKYYKDECLYGALNKWFPIPPSIGEEVITTSIFNIPKLLECLDAPECERLVKEVLLWVYKDMQ